MQADCHWTKCLPRRNFSRQQLKSNLKKKAKNSSVTFPARQLILRKWPSTLADLCVDQGDKSTPIQIYDVSFDVFRHLLFHLYWGKFAGGDLKCHAKLIIDTADRYSVVDLKLEAEACLVVENKVKVNRKIPFNYAPGALVNDVLAAMSRGEKKGGTDGDSGRTELIAMRISELRRKAHEKELNVDGSREMLIAALEKDLEEDAEENL